MKGFVTALLALCLLIPVIPAVTAEAPASGSAHAEHDFGLATVTAPAPKPAATTQQPAQQQVQAKPQPAKKPGPTQEQMAAAKRAAALKKARAVAAAKRAAAAKASAPKPAAVTPKVTAPVQSPTNPATPQAAAKPLTENAAPVAASNSNAATSTTSPGPAVSKSAAGTQTNPQPERQDKIALLLDEESKARSEPKSTTNWARTGFSTILKLGFVLVLAYLTILALKWLSDKRGSTPLSSTELQLRDTLKLSQSSSLHLVSVHGKTLLISSTPNQISLLTEIEQVESAENPQADNRFAEYLEKYSSGAPQSGPATRIAGLLRDATAHLKGRQPRLVSSGQPRRGDGDES